MSPTYRLHHVGILCDAPQRTTAYYRNQLGHEEIARFYEADEYDLTFLAAGSSLLLELIGPPFYGSEQRHYEKFGQGLQHLALAVDDVDAAFASLMAQGVEAVWEPETVLFVRHCGVRDNNGVVIEILQELEPLPKPTSNLSHPFYLHHFDLFSQDWRATKAFYERHFGFKSVFEYIYDSGGAFMYLADGSYAPPERQQLLEVIGPPWAEAREHAFAAQQGTGIDHIGDQVANLDAAFSRATAQNRANAIAPYQDYGTGMCWAQDPSGCDLELMLPLDITTLQQAYQTGQPVQPNRKE